MTVWITQWLCNQRHCSIGFFWDPSTETTEGVEQLGEQLYAKGTIKRICALCDGDLHPEHAKTKFDTMDEAKPEFATIELANLISRAAIEENRESFRQEHV